VVVVVIVEAGTTTTGLLFSKIVRVVRQTVDTTFRKKIECCWRISM
jgi:hypothetical protein